MCPCQQWQQQQQQQWQRPQRTRCSGLHYPVYLCILNTPIESVHNFESIRPFSPPIQSQQLLLSHGTISDCMWLCMHTQGSNFNNLPETHIFGRVFCFSCWIVCVCRQSVTRSFDINSINIIERIANVKKKTQLCSPNRTTGRHQQRRHNNQNNIW